METVTVKQKRAVQEKLFADKVELIAVPSVIGSGYEADVAKLGAGAITKTQTSRSARSRMATAPSSSTHSLR